MDLNSADTGGFRGMQHLLNFTPTLTTATQPGNVHKFVPSGQSTPEGWVPFTQDGQHLMKFHGFLRPTAQVPAHGIDDAAFEILCAETFNPNWPVFIIIEAPPTTQKQPDTDVACQGHAPDVGVRFAYPGWENTNGIQDGQFYTNPNYIVRALVRGTNVNVLEARIEPRLWERPATFQMQRNVELVRTIKAMLLTTDASWRPTTSNWPTPVATGIYAIQSGASFGGALAGWEAILFPDDFVGGFYGGAILSFRHYVGEQEGMRYLMSLSGFGEISRDFFRKDALHYHAALCQAAAMHGVPPTNWDPFYHGSVLRAWKDGYLKRPVLAIQADEDLATTANDVFPLLSGQREFVATGFSPPNQHGVPLIWDIVPKRCHGDGVLTESPFVSTTVVNQNDIVIEYIEWLLAHPALIGPATFQAPTTSGNGSMDVYDHAFMQPPPPAPTATPLQLTGFGGSGAGSLTQTVAANARRPGKSFGSGTYLGYADSLIAGVPVETDPLGYTGLHEIYVGSADGVVTRFAVEPTSGELVPQAMSPSLGYGAWGLTLGEANGLPGKEAIVATHRGLHTLNREDLSIMESKPDLPWEQSRPLRLATLQVKATGRSQVLFASDIGMLAIYDLDNLGPGSQPLATYFEPGVVDLAVLPSTTIDHARIAILSERGHVAILHWDLSGTTPSVSLEATSPRLNGIPVDLEVFDPDPSPEATGDEQLCVLMNQTIKDDHECIWVLDSALNVVNQSFTQRPEVVPTATKSAGVARDLEVWNHNGSRFFLVLREDRIFVIPFGNATGPEQAIVPIDLCAFQPMMRALDIAIANVYDDPNGSQEVLVASEAGYVTWFSTDELLGNQPHSHAEQTISPPDSARAGRLLTFDSATARTMGTANGQPMHCNRALSATWGMTLDDSTSPATSLRVLDQAGTLWRVNGLGDATFLQEAGTPRIALEWKMEPLAGPFRNLSWIGNPTGVSTTPGFELHNALDYVNGSTPIYQGLLTSNTLLIGTAPYSPVSTTPLQNVGGGNWLPIRDVLCVYGGFIAFPRSGDTLRIDDNPEKQYVCWWGGEEHFDAWGNRISGFVKDSAGTLSYWWSTIAPQSGYGYGGVHPWSEMHAHDLRSYHFQPMADRQAQALRMFADPQDPSRPRIAAFSPGARLFVLEPGNDENDIGPTPLEVDSATSKALDFGTGGMALAVGPPRSGGRCSIYVAPMAYFGDDTNFQANNGLPDDQVSAIGTVEFQGATALGSCTVTRGPDFVLDGSSSMAPKVYGACGLKVGDVLPAVPGPELVVASLDGHLLVYQLDQTTGQILPQPPLYQTRVEGAVGAYNSIVIADLVNRQSGTDQPGQDGINELYVAGSLGLRRWSLP